MDAPSTSQGPLDFGRSFVWFTSSRVDHTPRLQLAARCTITGRGKAPWVGYLSEPCIAESMYQPADLVHLPAVQVYFVIVPDTEVLMIKRSVDGRSEDRFDRKLGEAMPTFSGVPSRITELGVTLNGWSSLQPLDEYGEIRSATLAGAPLVGESVYESGDETVTLEYPISTMNVAHGRPSWQVDIGLAIVPDGDAAPDQPAQVAASPISRISLASIVYNTFDKIEIAAWARQGDESVDRTASIPARSRLWVGS